VRSLARENSNRKARRLSSSEGRQAFESAAAAMEQIVSDNDEVVKVELTVDGAAVDAATAPTANVQLSWDSTSSTNGRRRVAVAAFDSAGNCAEDVVEVFVQGGIPDTVAPTVWADPAGQQFTTQLTVSLHADELGPIYFTLDASDPTEASSAYSEPLVLTDDMTLRFFAVDFTGNAGAIREEVFQLLRYEETAKGTCTEHFVAGRLDTAGYNACGSANGFIETITLYRFGECWSTEESGSTCTE